MAPAIPRQAVALPAPVVKRIPRQSNLSGTVRKRDDSDMDLDRDGESPSPSKRPKVAFDAAVDVRIVDEWEKNLETIREEVRRAIEKRGRGDSSEYDRLKEVFSTSPTDNDAPSPTSMRYYTLALLGNVSMLNKSCSGVVHAILKSEWLGREETYVALYIRFLGNLVSVQAGYIRLVLKMLITALSNVSSSSGRLPRNPIIRVPEMYGRVHTALKYLLQLIPSASGVLSPILSETFPSSYDTRKAHIDYVRNLLRLTDYAPELKPEVLALITDRLVKIDVQIQIDIEELEEDVGEGVVQDVSQSRADMPEDADDDSDDSDAESISSDDALDEEAQRVKNVKANVEKMDIVMDILFTFYESSFSTGSSKDCEDAFDLLLTHFSTIILPTYRSRLTQFLLFHFAQTSPILIDRFAGTAVQLAFDKGRPPILKQSAAAYLASFVARGAHVPSGVVKDVFAIIGDQLDGIRFEHESNCRGPDLRRYGTFYAMVQALLYIFCFRWRDLTASPEDYVEDDDPATFDGRELTWAAGIRDTLTRTIYSTFNPLKVCSPSIVNEFARIANHLRFLYVFPLIETNKRIRLSQFSDPSQSSLAYTQPNRETALTAKKDESYQQLDTYFPFDPYHLPLSKRWIEGDYVEWKGIPGLDENRTAANTDTEEEEGEESGVEEGTETE
ncbi:MAG: hypothetical protein M1827_005528 [Pycnora praestabilis]|nr:MAG: hypothetical protein M1827_005528 [Pycnora praestabilis]